MERLTKKVDQMVWGKCETKRGTLFLEPCEIYSSQDGTQYIREMLVRLAAYEDTGLNPSGIKDMRNELCLLCGKYKEAHNGACDGCRWRKGETDETLCSLCQIRHNRETS